MSTVLRRLSSISIPLVGLLVGLLIFCIAPAAALLKNYERLSEYINYLLILTLSGLLLLTQSVIPILELILHYLGSQITRDKFTNVIVKNSINRKDRNRKATFTFSTILAFLVFFVLSVQLIFLSIHSL